VNDHDSYDHPAPKHKAWVDAVAVIARTGFFVLCSVFKEHRTEKARPELGALCAGPPASSEARAVGTVLLRSLLRWAKLLSGAESHSSGAHRTSQLGGRGTLDRAEEPCIPCCVRGDPPDRSDRLWWRKREVSRPFTLVQPSVTWPLSLPTPWELQTQFFGAEQHYRFLTRMQFAWSGRRQTPVRRMT
jgi:hypothetical protein